MKYYRKHYRSQGAKNRRDNVALTLHRYKLSSLYDDGKTQGECAYCGAYASTKDHVLPVVFMSFLLRQEDTEVYSEIVPCCSECNGLANARVFSSFQKKKEFVQARIFEKYSKIVEWTKEDIKEAELKGNLKDTVISQTKKRKFHQGRWLYYNSLYKGEVHKPFEEGHLKDVLVKSLFYEEEAKKLVERAKKREQRKKKRLSPAAYIFGVKHASTFCEISQNEFYRHIRRDNIRFIRDNLNHYAFKKTDLFEFKNDLDYLREEMSL